MKQIKTISRKLYSSIFVSKYYLYHEQIKNFEVLEENLTHDIENIYFYQFYQFFQSK